MIGGMQGHMNGDAAWHREQRCSGNCNQGRECDCKTQAQSEIERDAARLDWIADKCLTRPHGLWQWTFFGNTPHIRDAIDQAMQEGK